MTPWRKPSGLYMGRVYDTHGVGHRKSYETDVPATAKAITAFLEKLHDPPPRLLRAAQVIRSAICESRTSLYDAWLDYENGELDTLVAKLTAVSLAQFLDGWRQQRTGQVTRDTVQHYEHALTGLTKTIGWDHTAWTDIAIQDWLDNLECAGGTKRKKAAGIASFFTYVRKKRRDLFPHNLMADIDLPPASAPLTLYIETDEARRLADACEEPYRTLEALLAGTGIEVSVALGLTRRTVNVKTKEIEAAGTKTHARHRVARVAEWAWPYVEAVCAGKHADALLFPDIPDRWVARQVHNAVRDMLVEEHGLKRLAGYTMRDHRHTWAVRAARSGWPVNLMASQLGHVDGTLVLRVYGKWMPQQEERDRWEKVSTARDLEATGTSGVTSPHVTVEAMKPNLLQRNSRGGT